MKSYKLIIFILTIFLKTGTILSDDKIFNVNNIEVFNNDKESIETLANKAIKKAYDNLTKKILLDNDRKKLSTLNFAEIKQLISYYQIIKQKNENNVKKKAIFNISFDKNKFHNLFYKNGISYSEIYDKEMYLLPVLIKDDQIFIYSQNFFYQNWNFKKEGDPIEFILPIENIEIIQNINLNKDNLFGLELKNLFKEYTKKNLAVILIKDTDNKEIKIFLRTIISEKQINKNIVVKRGGLNDEEFSKKIITDCKKELIDIVKTQNLIDVRTPSFINTKLRNSNKNNLVELNKRLKKIDLVQNLIVQEFNNNYIFLKIKYLGKLEKIIQELEKQNVILKFKDDEWSIQIT